MVSSRPDSIQAPAASHRVCRGDRVSIVLGGPDGEELRSPAARETLAIPEALRREVAERDQGICRFCGRFVGESGAVHHVDFGGDLVGMGGRRHHALENLLTVGWLPGHDCHLGMLHARKLLWQPYARLAARRPGVTILQLRRWDLAQQRRSQRALR